MKIPVNSGTMINPKASLNTEAVSFDPGSALAEWHKAVGVEKYFDTPAANLRRAEALLRLKLIEEEFREVQDELLDFANSDGSREKLAKELADLLYVVFGAADVFDIPLARVFDAVHASNMTKVQANGSVLRRWDGKILKGPNYKEPNIASVFDSGVSN